MGLSALACGGLLSCSIAGLIFRFRIVTLFPTTPAEFDKEREWLTYKTKKSE
jgi:hypothetical protein